MDFSMFCGRYFSPTCINMKIIMPAKFCPIAHYYLMIKTVWGNQDGSVGEGACHQD